MTDKLRDAAQQALEALERFGDHDHQCPQYPTHSEPERYPPCSCGYKAVIDTLRAAMEQQDVQAVRRGWKLAPVEPTPEMCNPSGDVGIVAEMAARYRREIWESMLNTAPTPPAQQDDAALLIQCLTAMEVMMQEFRALDLPYGSKAYALAKDCRLDLIKRLATEPNAETVAAMQEARAMYRAESDGEI